MFRHLKPEEFVDLMENADPSPEQRTHLEGCKQCQATQTSLRDLNFKVTMLEDDVLEPDWSEFRTSVRDGMLSKSARRQSSSLWSLWHPLRPAFAWGFSLLLVAAVTGATVLWNDNPTIQQADKAPEFLSESAPLIETQGIDTEINAWSSGSVFDEIAKLESSEAENLLELLKTEGEGMFNEQ
jgi:hypothetical protein